MRLVAAVDPAVVMDPPTIYGVDLYAELTQALDAVGPVDVVVIAAPIGDHFRLAQIALTSGADVYLEKPPVASMDDFDSLLATERETGHVVQVGFQSLGSRGLEMLETDALGVGRAGQGERRWSLVADCRLLEPFTLGRPPQPARPSSQRRGRHKPLGTCGGHRTSGRRLPPA